MMSSSFVEYEIYIPTVNLEGKAFETTLLNDLKKNLIDQFGGITDTRHKNEGIWKVGSISVRDEIVIWRILSDQGSAGDQFIKKIQGQLEQLFQQDKILIIKRQVESI